jgi:hypothetical protein
MAATVTAKKSAVNTKQRLDVSANRRIVPVTRHRFHMEAIMRTAGRKPGTAGETEAE